MRIETPRPTLHERLLDRRRPVAGAARARALAAVLTLGLLAIAGPAAGEVVNRIVLRVNEEILTLHEYEQRKGNEISILLADQRLDPTQRQERLEQIGRAVMQNSFSEMLLLSFANQQGIRVTDSEVEEAVSELLKKQGIETQQQLQEALASSGMTIEQVRENTYRELLWQQVVGREVQPKVVIGDEELRAYYRTHQKDFVVPEQRWLKDVVVLESSGVGDAELRRIAGEVRAQLAAGGEPEAVLEPYQEKGLTGGMVDLDWLRAGELEATLSSTAWALSPGDYSQPVLGRGGYHILHLAGVREAEQRPLSEVENLIRQREFGRRFNRELRTFLADLEKKSYIQEDLPEEAVGYRALTSQFETQDEIELFRAPVLETPSDDDAPAEGTADGG